MAKPAYGKPARPSNAQLVVDNTMGTDTQQYDQQPAQGGYQPIYKMIGDAKVPVSKSTGKLWQARKEQSLKFMDDLNVIKAWEETLKYYKNDQSTTKEGERDPERENRSTARRFSKKHSQTENVVFANVSAMVPSTYAKNPDVEITATDKAELEEFALTCKTLINYLIRTKVAPGVNLKPKMKRGVVMATLTNLCFFEVGYVMKEQSSDQALQDLQATAKKLETAKDTKELQQLEGELMAMEHRVAILNPSGPFVKFRDPRGVLGDPNNELSDFSDCTYLMIEDMVPTEMLRALYGTKNSKGEWESIYAPTHVMKVSGSATDGLDLDITFSPFAKDKRYGDYGYRDEQTYKYAQVTRVWYVWDKATRRVLLFNNDDWCYPLWVWDDPYQLDTFFNIEPLAFYTDPETPYARSEVMYYLDQQDEINKLNSEVRRMREFLTGKFIVNTAVMSVDDAEKILSSTNTKSVIGVKADPEADMKKAFVGVELPGLSHVELFDKKSLYDAIDRMSSVSTIMRNQEFKTNTTNKAIESYNSSSQTRLDEKVDAVEECIGNIGWKMLQMCIRFMSSDEVVECIGEKHRQIWEQNAKVENIKHLGFSVVGGSAQKPTAKAKKDEAVQVGQILGQFASGAPAAILIMMKMMERAFDGIVIKDDDWKMLIDSVTAQMQKGRTDGAAGQPSGGGAAANPSGGAGGGGGSVGPGAPDVNVKQIVGELDKIVEGLPPAVVKAFGTAIASGGKPSEVIDEILKTMQQHAGQQQQVQQASQ